MRAVVQRVSCASVSIHGNIVGEIGVGLLVLLGIESDDTDRDIEWLVSRLTRVRIFEDAEGRMNLSVRDINGNALVISQFTLLGSIKKGSRPSFNRAAASVFALPLYEKFISALSSVMGISVATGRFGAKMDVALVNDGPVTLVLDSRLPEL